MKPIETMRVKKTILLFFDHGLGDFVNFLPVYKELKRQLPGKKISLGCPIKRQFNTIYPETLIIDPMEYRNLLKYYDFVYQVGYPDSKSLHIPSEHFNESQKPYLCAFEELGLDDFIWKPFKLDNNRKIIEKRVGVHFFGFTGMADKGCSIDVMNEVWSEIIDAGFEPFEMHMEPKFKEEYDIYDRGDCETLPFLNKDNSLRFQEPNLSTLFNAIKTCRFFVGIDSGPIYLASTVMNNINIIGLINQKRHDHFYPQHMNLIDVSDYVEGSIYDRLKYLEKYF